MGKLGFDIVAGHLNENDLAFCQQAVKNYNGFKVIVWHGNQYRLASPYENPVASIAYVSEDKSNAIMFTYLHNNRFMNTATERPIKLNGLEAVIKYKVKELNLFQEQNQRLITVKSIADHF